MPPVARKPKSVPNPPTKTGPGSDEPFRYVTEAGGEFTVPSLGKLFRSAGEMRRMRKMSPMDLVFYVIERDSDQERLDDFDEMSMEEFESFSEQWAVHSGVDLGESLAS